MVNIAGSGGGQQLLRRGQRCAGERERFVSSNTPHPNPPPTFNTHTRHVRNSCAVLSAADVDVSRGGGEGS